MIRLATIEEAAALTRLSIASKRHWRYPEHYYDIFKKELAITPDYIEKNTVFVFEQKKTLIGFYSVVILEQDLETALITIEKGSWLDHMFIAPQFIGRGIGRQLFAHLKSWCGSSGVKTIRLLADPNAQGFYEKMGCRYIEEYPSTIAKRTTPLLELTIAEQD